MIRYTYSAVDSAGFSRTGRLQATSRDEAVGQIFALKLTPVSLQPEASAESSSANTLSGAKAADVTAFIRELATLLSSGVGLTEALDTLHDATTQQGLRASVSSLMMSVQSGEPLSVGLRSARLPLPEYVYALTRAGEATGNLGAALGRCADQLEFDQRMRSETREALIYPAILIATGITAIGFIFSFVVPRFANLMSGRKVDLPWIAQAVLSAGMFVHTHWLSVLAGVFALGVGIYVMTRQSRAREIVLQALARFPVLSGWMAGAETARWTSVLAVLLQSRVPILLALELAATAVRLPDNARRLLSMLDEVRQGKALSQATEERGMLEGSPLSMVKVGEKSGDLAGMLGHVAAHAAERHRSLQRRLVALIEPLSILVIGVVIGIIMVGIVLAMTSLTEVKL